MKAYLNNRFVIIFVNSQVAIRALFFFKQQSEQYMLRNLVKKLTNSDKRSHLHWISTHEEVSSNEAIDEAVKKIVEWKSDEREIKILRRQFKILISAVRIEYRQKVKIDWAKAWRTEITNRIFHRIIETFNKQILRKFKLMTRFESVIIVQIRTEKIDLRDYLYKIDVANSSNCLCDSSRQTMQHTLLKYSRFDEFKEKM
jgi:hypothetical protein